MSAPQIVEMVQRMDAELDALKRQLEWFRRQMFGEKSERRLTTEPDARQMLLAQMIAAPTAQESDPKHRQVPAHTRRVARKDVAAGEDVPFFDESKVPVEVIELSAPETKGLSAEDYEVISHKVSYRLAQRPGSTVVLKYVRPVVKLKASEQLVCPAAPAGVFEGSRADVSFVAGLLNDKFTYHMPFYRQHQRLADNGITVSRPWLTQIGQKAIALLEPIYEALFASVRASRVLAMDETPIKAGRAEPGKLKAAYFWPVYGDQDEVCFPFFESRRHEHVEQALGLDRGKGSVLVSDGYDAYSKYAAKAGITHAACWAHARRTLFEAKDVEPAIAEAGLDLIGGLYAVEERIRELKLNAPKKLDYRLTYAKPIAERFFDWIDRQFEAQGLLPSNPMTNALAYARDRRAALEVYLTDPEVPIDTNHLERALRVIPMGRRAWLFSWTELGAYQVGIMQSLIVTCRLHQVDPYTYLVDVLQRVGTHPASRVAELTPRLWKQHFAANPLRSALHSHRP